MGRIELTIETQPAAGDVEVLGEGLTRHALPFTRVAGFRPLAVFARDERGGLVGGVSGQVNWSWLHVSRFWVAEEQRGRGLGARLLAAIEDAARERGCTHAHLDTFSYQARPFYERRGYAVFATLDEYPPGHRRLFMQKALGESAPRRDAGATQDVAVAARPLAAGDVEALHRAFAGTRWDRGLEHFARLAEEHASGTRRVFVGTAGSAPVGFGSLVFASGYPPFRERGIPEIQDLNVTPAFRRRGIASRILDAAEHDAFERGDAVGIGVGLHPAYGPAQRLYARRGYLPDGLGAFRKGRFPAEGEQVTLDDELTLHLVKRRPGP